MRQQAVSPRPGLVQSLMNVEVEGSRLTEDEIVRMVRHNPAKALGLPV